MQHCKSATSFSAQGIFVLYRYLRKLEPRPLPSYFLMKLMQLLEREVRMEVVELKPEYYQLC